MRILVTGAAGLLGQHAAVHLHALNCAATFHKKPTPVDLVLLDHAGFDDDETLLAALKGTDIILHFAGVNKAMSDAMLERANPNIAHRLIEFCQLTRSDPHIIHANSIHSKNDTPYGRSKYAAAQILSKGVTRFTDLIVPHVFGEGARANYNSVTATFISKILHDETPQVNGGGHVDLVHAGKVAQSAVNAAMSAQLGQVDIAGQWISVLDLLTKLQGFHALYADNIFPNLSNPFDVALFNTYRAAIDPNKWARPLPLHTDNRGRLFEAAKGGGGGQTFMSSTLPGVTRGDHFHLNKVERFLVVQGDAIIRMRKVLDNQILEFRVSGDTPTPIDIPTIYTHSIENVGRDPLLTLFWSHDLFDPANPDTFADKVLYDTTENHDHPWNTTRDYSPVAGHGAA